MFQAKALSAQIVKVAADTEALQADIKQVDKYTSDTQAKQAELAPIKAKVDFANEADKSGRGYWKVFHDLNEYISQDAQMTRFSVTGSTVSFEVKLKGTVAAAKFIINLLRCPVISGISVSGLPGAGAGAMPGGPSGAPPGAPPGPPAGMPGAPAGPAAGLGGAPGSPNEILTFTINATLNPAWQITVPTPPGGAAPGAAGFGGPPGAPPGAPPGMAPPPPSAPAGGAPQGGAKAGADGETGSATPKLGGKKDPTAEEGLT